MKTLIFLFAFSFLLIAGLAGATDPSRCININTAPKEELVKIKQIGEARAEQIMNLRKEKLFSSVDDLDRVVGIGPARIADIKKQGLACVEEDSTENSAQPSSNLAEPSLTPDLTDNQRKAIAPEKKSATVGISEPSEDRGASLLLPVAIFTSFSSGVIILLLKRYVRT